ncbi:hypothetical protein [Occultella kanbiaonis]|uniref:hypothetical protein n=1 Tax=Occultella kanbiaonis TaxID=2675754 RepID=UPI0012B80E75|nr:hypothetical protein [Occultella kanbiaonis]
MGFYLLRRLGQAAVVLSAALTVSSVILYILPGDPVAIMVNPGGQTTYVDPEAEAALRAELGFDTPLIEQTSPGSSPPCEGTSAWCPTGRHLRD